MRNWQNMHETMEGIEQQLDSGSNKASILTEIKLVDLLPMKVEKLRK
jgi:hypothetical protein